MTNKQIQDMVLAIVAAVDIAICREEYDVRRSRDPNQAHDNLQRLVRVAREYLEASNPS